MTTQDFITELFCEVDDQWNGLQPDENGFVHLSIAEFSL
jgi:hypothetical protein